MRQPGPVRRDVFVVCARSALPSHQAFAMSLDAPLEILVTAFNHAVLVGLSDLEYAEIERSAAYQLPEGERNQLEARERQS